MADSNEQHRAEQNDKPRSTDDAGKNATASDRSVRSAKMAIWMIAAMFFASLGCMFALVIVAVFVF